MKMERGRSTKMSVEREECVGRCKEYEKSGAERCRKERGREMSECAHGIECARRETSVMGREYGE
jgi:hypothetical protein